MKKLVGILVLAAAGGANAAQEMAAPSFDAAGFRAEAYAGPSINALRCVAPEVPEVSQVNLRIRSVSKAIRQWQNCHRGVLAALAPERAAEAIPAQALAAMTPAERKAATRHVAAVHAQLADALQREAQPVIARHDAWRDATLAYVAGQNSVTPGTRALAWAERFAREERKSEALQRQVALGLPAR
jgi:hypothetical protein